MSLIFSRADFQDEPDDENNNDDELLDKFETSDELKLRKDVVIEHVEVGMESQVDVYTTSAYGEIETLQSLVHLDPDCIFCADSFGITALHEASRHGQTHVVKYLLQKGCAVSALTLCQQSPLHFACAAGHLDIVSLLLDHETHANTPTSVFVSVLAQCDFRNKTALHHASQNNHQDIVQLLLVHGADASAVDSEGSMALEWVGKFRSGLKVFATTVEETDPDAIVREAMLTLPSCSAPPNDVQDDYSDDDSLYQ